MKEKKSFMFIVQGEGRGHLTQAISMYTILKKHNMELCCIVAGNGGRNELPEFFLRRFTEPVVSVASPCFSKDKKSRSVRLWKTIIKNAGRIHSYLKSVFIIRKLVTFHKPDLIINFYEPLFAIYQILFRHESKVISVSHQNIYLHEDFIFPEKQKWKKIILKQYTKYVSFHSDKILALSPYELEPSANNKLQVIPPLLREEVLKENVSRQQFILVYMVNNGYMEDIIKWHLGHPELMLHVFTDSDKVKSYENGVWRYTETLCFHSLHDRRFIQMMASCQALVTTAGFESVCEAMYFGKPVLMVPVEGQYEQYCNARDAKKAGAGIFSDHFDITRLLNYIPFHSSFNRQYHLWLEKTEASILQAIESLYIVSVPASADESIDVLRRFPENSFLAE